MAFLDFIKDRGMREQSAQQSQQSQQQKPDTAREMYARQAETTKPVSQISPDQQARVDAVKSDLQKATQWQGKTAEAPATAPQDGASSPQPMMQKSMNQDKAASPLSPTTAQVGTRSTEQEAPVVASQEKTQEKSQGRPQTISRPSPSWER